MRNRRRHFFFIRVSFVCGHLVFGMKRVFNNITITSISAISCDTHCSCSHRCISTSWSSKNYSHCWRACNMTDWCELQIFQWIPFLWTRLNFNDWRRQKNGTHTKIFIWQMSWLKYALVHWKLDFHFQRIPYSVSLKSHQDLSNAVTRAALRRGCVCAVSTLILFSFFILCIQKSIFRKSIQFTIFFRSHTKIDL